MRHAFAAGIALALLAYSVVAGKHAVDEDQAAREIIRRAIDVQGGEGQVERLLKPWRAKVKGSAGPLRTTGSIIHQGPDHGRIEVRMDMGGKQVEVVVVCNGETAWQRINGVTREVTGPELEEMKDGGYRSRKVRFLLPILTERGFRLSLLADADVSNRPASGVRVQHNGHRDVDLYFDKENGRLVKTESRVTAPDKAPIVLEQVFSDYKDFDGVKLATKFTKYENGQLRSIEEITELTFVKQIDAQELARP
jgi:hypothetical protein